MSALIHMFTDRRGVAKHGSKGSRRHEQSVTPTGGDNERCDLGELVSKERFAFLCGVRYLWINLMYTSVIPHPNTAIHIYYW
ncbi:hypothetical protein Q1695_016449 [Nippostrongylus brasiliensis]|nr:hypothetical protein Q1695_016449 [Nippostrongylus brasiliensis]